MARTHPIDRQLDSPEVRLSKIGDSAGGIVAMSCVCSPRCAMFRHQSGATCPAGISDQRRGPGDAGGSPSAICLRRREGKPRKSAGDWRVPLRRRAKGPRSCFATIDKGTSATQAFPVTMAERRPYRGRHPGELSAQGASTSVVEPLPSGMLDGPGFRWADV